MSGTEYNVLIAELGLTKTEFAKVMGVSRRTIHRRINGKAEINNEITLAIKSLRQQRFVGMNI